MNKSKTINLLVLIVAIALTFMVGCSKNNQPSTENKITTLEMTDFVFGETPGTPTIAATHGADTVKYYYATAEDGEYAEISDFSTLKPGVYYLKAVIEKTDSYKAAEKTITFEVKMHASHTPAGEWLSDGTNHWKLCACGEKTAEAAHTSDDVIHYNADKTKQYNECSVCGEKMNETAHTHAAKDDKYLSDDSNHWKLCVCGEKVGETAHTSDNNTYYNEDKTKEYNKCSVCDSEINETAHTHAAKDDTYLSDGTNHWKLCACGEKVGEAAHTSDNVIHYNDDKTKQYNECSACGEKMNETAHTHTAKDDKYLSDDSNHWKLCACGEKVGEAEHTSDNVIHYNADKTKQYNECSVCGEKMNETAHTHAAKDDKYLSDDSNHWKLCVCGETVGVTEHVSDGVTHYDVENMKEYNSCDVCGAKMNEAEHIHDYASTATENGYACACGVAVNPFKGLAKAYLEPYDSTKVTLSTETLFGGKKYVAKDMASGNGIGVGNGAGLTSTEYYKEYYYALRISENAVMAEGGNLPLGRNTWYIVKMTARTDDLGGWDFYITQPSNTEWQKVNVSAWRAGAYSGFNGKAEFAAFFYFATGNGGNYNLDISELYVREIDFSAEFDGMTNVADSAINSSQKSSATIGDLEVYYKENLTRNNTKDTFSVGSKYTMGDYSEYRFAIKASRTVLLAAANGANAIDGNIWYIVKVRKVEGAGDGEAKWKMYVKQVGTNDSAFREILSIDSWKVGSETTALSTMLDSIFVYNDGFMDDVVFNLYMTGIWAK